MLDQQMDNLHHSSKIMVNLHLGKHLPMQELRQIRIQLNLRPIISQTKSRNRINKLLVQQITRIVSQKKNQRKTLSRHKHLVQPESRRQMQLLKQMVRHQLMQIPREIMAITLRLRLKVNSPNSRGTTKQSQYFRQHWKLCWH